MDESVWLQPDPSVPTDATEGDVVLTPAGSLIQVARVDAEGLFDVCAEVAPELIPGLDAQGAEAHRIEDEEVLRAVRGVLAAERERGG